MSSPSDMDPADRAQLSLELQIGYFELYLDQLEEHLAKQFQIHTRNLADLTRRRDRSEITAEEWDAWSFDPKFYLDAIDWHRTFLRRSFFISIYAYMEHRVLEECRTLEQPGNTQLSSIEARNDLDRARLFYGGLERKFPSADPAWREIQEYRRLRNCIVHGYGLVNESRGGSHLLRYIQSKKGLLSLMGDEVYFEDGFCKEVYQTIKDFLCLLILGHKVE